jgi:hypothetical protein
VYNRYEKLPLHDTTVYRVRVSRADSELFVRYSILNDTGSYIHFLPIVVMDENSIKSQNDPSKDSIYYLRIGSSSDLGHGSIDSFYFQFKQSSQTPPQKYLATSHITGLPITIPIKWRYQTGPDANVSPISLNFNVSYAFGYKVRTNNNPFQPDFLRFLLFTGFGSDNYVPKDSIKSTTYKPITNVTWTYGGGLTFEIGNRFNIGLMYGADRMLGNKKDWFYENKAWLGFGIGYKFQ